MIDLTPDHPAVEAAFDAYESATLGGGKNHMESIIASLSAALPCLTSATEENLSRLRNTEAGRALLVEGWHAGYDDGYDTGYCAGKREHPTATREVHYCMEDQQEWPCRTVQAIEEQN